MTQTAIKLIEKRFVKLGGTLDKDIWNSGLKLYEYALKIEGEDVALARRVMQRARNLSPGNPGIRAELKRLGEEVEKRYPASESSSSTGEVVPISADAKHVEPSEGPVMSTTVKESGSQDKAFSSRLIERMRTPTFLLVVLPILLFAFYQLVWASERYESRAQVIVQQPNDLSAMDPSMALLSGFGLSTPASTDALLVQAFIYSDDMLSYLDDRLSLRTHYTESGADLFSRLSSTASKEDFLDFYQSHVTVEIDEKSSVITVLAQAFDEEFAHQLNVAIVERAEWYINSIGHTLANEQLAFVRGEHQLIESRLDNAKRRLLGFQQQYNLLDPEAEGMALQQIAYSLESQLASKKAELKSLRSVMSDEAPQVMTLQSQVRALEAQLENERSRLSLQRRNESSEEGSLALGELSSVSEVLATYTEFKVELELALQAYTASEVSLEKSRIEAYRQLKYLMIVESPTSPESNQYPKVLYNLALFSAVILMLFAIGRIIVATARELR